MCHAGALICCYIDMVTSARSLSCRAWRSARSNRLFSGGPQLFTGQDIGHHRVRQVPIEGDYVGSEESPDKF